MQPLYNWHETVALHCWSAPTWGPQLVCGQRPLCKSVEIDSCPTVIMDVKDVRKSDDTTSLCQAQPTEIAIVIREDGNTVHARLTQLEIIVDSIEGFQVTDVRCKMHCYAEPPEVEGTQGPQDWVF